MNTFPDKEWHSSRKTILYLFLFLFLIISSEVLGQKKQIYSVIDDNNQTITLNEPAKRIVSLTPHLSEIVFFLGHEEKLVARDSASDFPESIKHIPSIGNSANLNTEAILALKPDLILAWKSGNTQKQIKQLQSFDIPIFFSEPRTLNDISENMEKISVLLSGNKNEEKIKSFTSRIKTLEETFSKNKENLRVFYQVWQEPLMTLNGEHLVSEIIKLCRGENIFSDQKILAPQVSLEALIQRNPQLIILGDKNKNVKSYWGKWKSIEAVRNNNFIFVNSDLLVRPGPRILEGVEQVCQGINKARPE
jgi:iron complex transport system substrate-binding protein